MMTAPATSLRMATALRAPRLQRRRHRLRRSARAGVIPCGDRRRPVPDRRTIRLERHARVTTLILDRPAVHNAFSDGMAAEITEAMTALAGDDQTGAVIVTGAGEASFCAGADLKEMRARVEAGG